LGVNAPRNAAIVANAVAVDVVLACAAACADSIQDVAVAVAVALRNIVATASKDRARAVAYTAAVIFAHAVVFVVANAVAVLVGGASSTAHPKDVFHVACAITSAHWDVRAATTVNGSWTVAHAAFVRRAHARVAVVANAVSIFVSRTGSSARAQGVHHIAVAVAIALRNV